jgi:glycosyltransferase involved in cell wall biosynthesis
MNKSQDLKVALVHDFLIHYGGAERVLEVLAEMFPGAPIYTLLYDKEKMRGKLQDKVIHTSFLQNFPGFMRRRLKYLLPFLPTAPETFDLRDFDLVITSSGAWSKGIVTRLNVVHVAYIHSPMRFVWDKSGDYLAQQKKSSAVNLFAKLLSNYVRMWDRSAADRPDYMVANSKYTQKRIKKYYGRESMVIYPPVFAEDKKFQFPISNFQSNLNDQISNSQNNSKFKIQNSKFFLIVSRLSPYKKIDAVVEAFNKLELPLVVIGEGQQEKYLRKIAGKNVRVLGWQTDEKTREYYSNARAFLFAGVDDFGIAPVEAMAYGVPVLALRKGGAQETVIEGKTGEFFDSAIPEVIVDGVRRLIENEKNYDKELIKARAKEFSKDSFIKEFGGYIENIIKNENLKN